MLRNMKKIKNWIFKSKIDLSKKWWHRLFKVLFILSFIVVSLFVMTFLSNSYSQITHQWMFVDGLSNRLSDAPYSGKVLSINELYSADEVISEEMYTSKMNFSLEGKDYLEPLSAMFLDDYQSKSFCSNKLDENIKNIAETNNIKLFSAVNSTLRTLSSDIDAFTKYLKDNSYSISCVMIDSYTTTDDNGETLKSVFLKPIDTAKYNIYEYKNNLLGFILNVLLSIAFLLFCAICTIIFYYKVVLYIVFGKVDTIPAE